MLASFLFCKQKTAYDMRISDWSSDVCSSDLSLPVAAMRCPKSFAIRPRDLPCEILPVSRSGTSVSHCGRTFGRPTGESGHTRRTESRLPARRSACRPWPLTRPLKGGTADLPDRRSEEHPSELQSLMR